MKRYILFTGSNYYPSGGWEDFNATSDDIADLADIIKADFTEQELNTWWHILDTKTMDIIYDIPLPSRTRQMGS